VLRGNGQSPGQFPQRTFPRYPARLGLELGVGLVGLGLVGLVLGLGLELG